MKKSNIVIIIYLIGIGLGAIFLDIWGAEQNIKKGLFALGWTAIFLIAYLYADKNTD